MFVVNSVKLLAIQRNSYRFPGRRRPVEMGKSGDGRDSDTVFDDRLGEKRRREMEYVLFAEVEISPYLPSIIDCLDRDLHHRVAMV
jgi:hypothetical protein